MAVLQHIGDVLRGQGLDDIIHENMEVDTDEEDTLYSGRVCYKDSDGEPTEGHGSDQTDILYFVVEGVENPSVQGSDAISPALTDENRLHNNIGTVPFQQGLKVLTTEYDDGETYEVGDPVEITDSTTGTFTLGSDPTSDDVVAVVAEEPHQWQDLDVLTLEIIRQAPVA